MKRLDEIVGQKAAVDVLQRMIASGRIPHALLFDGPESIGKFTTARAFAAVLMCKRGETTPCGSCSSCELLERSTHPDWVLVVPGLKKSVKKSIVDDPSKASPEDFSRFIVIDQIREVIRLSSLAPRMGRRRVIVFDPADRMNPESQNALLKTLEEPPQGSTVILLASRANGLLPTVRSRCFRVPFLPFGTRVLSDLLVDSGVPSAEAIGRAALAAGKAADAFDLDLDTARERREKVLAALEMLVGDPSAAAAIPAIADVVAGRHETDLLAGLELMQGLLRDAARASVVEDDDELVHADLAARLRKLGLRIGMRRSAAIVAAIERLRGELRFNLNRTLLAESLLSAVAGGPLP